MLKFLYNGRPGQHKQNEKTKEPKQNNSINTNGLKYLIKDSDFKIFLDMLPQFACDDNQTWHEILGVAKKYGFWTVFDQWSKKSKFYNYQKNLDKYTHDSGNVNINYFIKSFL